MSCIKKWIPIFLFVFSLPLFGSESSPSIECDWFEADQGALGMRIELPEYIDVPDTYQTFSVRNGQGIRVIFSEQWIEENENGLQELTIEVILTKGSDVDQVEYEILFLESMIGKSNGERVQTSKERKEMGSLGEVSPHVLNSPPELQTDGESDHVAWIVFGG